MRLSQAPTGDWCTALSHHIHSAVRKQIAHHTGERVRNYREVVNGAASQFRFHTNVEGTDTKLS